MSGKSMADYSTRAGQGGRGPHRDRDRPAADNLLLPCPGFCCTIAAIRAWRSRRAERYHGEIAPMPLKSRASRQGDHGGQARRRLPSAVDLLWSTSRASSTSRAARGSTTATRSRGRCAISTASAATSPRTGTCVYSIMLENAPQLLFSLMVALDSKRRLSVRKVKNCINDLNLRVEAVRRVSLCSHDDSI